MLFSWRRKEGKFDSEGQNVIHTSLLAETINGQQEPGLVFGYLYVYHS